MKSIEYYVKNYDVCYTETENFPNKDRDLSELGWPAQTTFASENLVLDKKIGLLKLKNKNSNLSFMLSVYPKKIIRNSIFYYQAVKLITDYTVFNNKLWELEVAWWED